MIDQFFIFLVLYFSSTSSGKLLYRKIWGLLVQKSNPRFFDSLIPTRNKKNLTISPHLPPSQKRKPKSKRWKEKGKKNAKQASKERKKRERKKYSFLVFTFIHHKGISSLTLQHSLQVFDFFFLKTWRKLHPLFIMVGQPNIGRESRSLPLSLHGLRAVEKQPQDKNKPYTFPLFSPFKTPKLNCFYFLSPPCACFCCIKDSPHNIQASQVKEERVWKKNLNKKRKKWIYENGIWEREKERE